MKENITDIKIGNTRFIVTSECSRACEKFSVSKLGYSSRGTGGHVPRQAQLKSAATLDRTPEKCYCIPAEGNGNSKIYVIYPALRCGIMAFFRQPVKGKPLCAAVAGSLPRAPRI